MLTCDACGFENVPGTLFCEGCGKSLIVATSGGRRGTAQMVTGDIDTAADAVTEAPADVAAPTVTEVEAASASGAYLIAESGRRLDLPLQDVVIVGREDLRSGTRPDLDLTLDGASAAGVSRRHCRLLHQPDGWHVEDLMSTNYTVLNGKPLPAHTPTPLRDSDELRLGKLRLRFYTS